MKRVTIWVVGCALAAVGCGDSTAPTGQSTVGQFEREMAALEASQPARMLPDGAEVAKPLPPVHSSTSANSPIALASATESVDASASDVIYVNAAALASARLAAKLTPMVEQAKLLEGRQRYTEAITVHQQIADELESSYGADAWQALNARLALSQCQRRARLNADQQQQSAALDEAITLSNEQVANRKLPAALAAAKQAREIAVALWGEQDQVTAATTHLCGELLQGLGEFQQAEAMFRSALETRKELLHLEHPETLASMNALAMLLQHQGRATEAEPLLREAVRVSTQVWGRDNRQHAKHLTNLGTSLMVTDQAEEAIGWLEMAVALQRKTYGEQSPYTALTLFNLGSTYYQLHNFDAALPPLVESSDRFTQSLGRQHPMTLRSLASQGMTLLVRRDFAAAETVLREVESAHRQRSGDADPEVAAIEFALGMLYAAQGHYPQAKPLLLAALSTQQRHLGPQHPTTQETAAVLAKVDAKLAERAQE